ncbi:DUF484 family protein [Shewanella marisflavi]|uniref:DUF484 family protein n=2 Tax=Shewanellaceae TaxID=267890 RepID=A0AAC9U4G5_9GAMM|nr:DUF484 family protein [Shewanella marisflavi]ASJ98532.1 hypothetical protein CFF01_01590 [Shewanella marisflavi]MCL1042745.1 DUF484 family protein [Shewanella marisflavi]QDF77128.1 DUF484 family protein [Shewanella marisflavi]
MNEKAELPFDEVLIREYLLDNPDFFARYPELLLAMRIPHEQRGAVSLVERRQEMLRARVTQLEEEITSLLAMASRNEQIYMFNTALSLRLLQAEDLGDLRQILSNELQQQFHFTHVRLITVHDIDSELSNIWSERLKQGYYFGRLTQTESKRLFGCEVGSVALSRLSQQCGQVIFAIASQDPTHFHPEMDNLLLDQLKQLLDHLLPKL